MDVVRFGLVGLGVHGTRYANHLSAGDVDGAALTAVCRRDAEAGQAYAKEHGVAFHADHAALVASDDVDAVVVTTPTSQHLPVARAAADAGKHVLVEKPMGRTVDECRGIIDACAAAAVKLMVSQTLRYNAVIAEMRRRAADLGTVVHMGICQRQEPSTTAWHNSLEAAGGGNMIENGVHLFDAARWISGREVVSAYCEIDRLAGNETEDIFAAILNLDNGCRCCIDACKYTASRFAEIQIVGQEGQLIGSPTGNTLFMVQGREAQPIDPPAAVPGLPCTLSDFVKAIAEDAAPAITGEDGLAAVAIARACYDSASSGRPVELSR